MRTVVTRRRPFHSLMLALALFAAGLLAFAPSVSRLLMPTAPAGWIALCSATGMKWLRVAPGAGVQPDIIDVQGRGNSGSTGDDCSYCPLLASLATLFSLLLLALLQHAQARPPSPRRTPARVHRHPSGLGSRGPPRQFQILI